MEHSDIRLYNNEIPHVNDLVTVRVNDINDINADVSLIEYKNIHAILPLTELSKKKIRSLRKIIKKGQLHIVKVIDNDNNCICLSKKQVFNDEVLIYKEKFEKARTAFTLMNKVSKKNNIDVRILYESFCWEVGKDFGNVMDGLHQIYKDNIMINKYNINDEIKNYILGEINQKFGTKEITIIKDFNIYFIGDNSLDLLKNYLKLIYDELNLKYETILYSKGTPLYTIESKIKDSEKEEYDNMCNNIFTKHNENTSKNFGYLKICYVAP